MASRPNVLSGKFWVKNSGLSASVYVVAMLIESDTMVFVTIHREMARFLMDPNYLEHDAL